ncbi:membrane protein [Massilia sp. BSC265]|nr:membrane protein [Massilia sp. BSC265]
MLMKHFKFPAYLLPLGLLAFHGAAQAEFDLPAVGNVHAPISVAKPEIIPEGSWFTSAELGAITTSGNTTGTSVTGKIDARHETANWSHEFIVSGFFKEDEYENEDGNTERSKSAERFAASAKASLKLLGEHKRAFVIGSHVIDRFGAYTRYSSVAVGHGSRWLNSSDKSLDVELGPGYFAGERATGEDESGLTVRGAAQFRWRVSPSAFFAQTVSVEKGTSNTRSVAETSLSTKINSTMQMKAGFSARNDTSVPDGKKNTDTQTSLTMVYSF